MADAAPQDGVSSLWSAPRLWLCRKQHAMHGREGKSCPVLVSAGGF